MEKPALEILLGDNGLELDEDTEPRRSFFNRGELGGNSFLNFDKSLNFGFFKSVITDVVAVVL